jgi:hypothetical protein
LYQGKHGLDVASDGTPVAYAVFSLLFIVPADAQENTVTLENVFIGTMNEADTF